MDRQKSLQQAGNWGFRFPFLQENNLPCFMLCLVLGKGAQPEPGDPYEGRDLLLLRAAWRRHSPAARQPGAGRRGRGAQGAGARGRPALRTGTLLTEDHEPSSPDGFEEGREKGEAATHSQKPLNHQPPPREGAALALSLWLSGE